MSTLRETLDDLASALRERPDDLLLEIGAGGELLVARLRVLVACLLLLLPALNWLGGGLVSESAAGLAGAVGVLMFSVAWLRLALRSRRPPWLPMFSSCFDVTLVTGVLALLGLGGLPVATLNSTVVWSCYLLAIFATAMRHDLRVTLVAGFASTLAFPAGAWLAGHFGWQVAVWVGVFVALGLMLPLQALAARVVARATWSRAASSVPPGRMTTGELVALAAALTPMSSTDCRMASPWPSSSARIPSCSPACRRAWTTPCSTRAWPRACAAPPNGMPTPTKPRSSTIARARPASPGGPPTTTPCCWASTADDRDVPDRSGTCPGLQLSARH